MHIMVTRLQAYCKHAQSKAHAQQQQQQQQLLESTLLRTTMSTLNSSSVLGSTTLRQSQSKATAVADNDTLTVLVLHCIWNAIVGSKRSEARFLQCEVYAYTNFVLLIAYKSARAVCCTYYSI